MALRGAAERAGREVVSFTQVKAAPGRWRFALHATTCVTAALVVLTVVLGPALGIIGLTGTFLGFSASAKPLRARITVLACTSVSYVVLVTLGGLVGDDPILLTAFFVVVGIISVLGFSAFVGDRPGPMFFVIGPAIASYLTTVGIPLHVITVAGALGVGVSSACSLLLQWLERNHPERDAVEAAGRAVAAYVDATPGTLSPAQIGRLRDQAYAEIFSASMLVEQAVGRQPRSRRWRRLNRRLRHLHAQVIRRVVSVYLPGSPLAISALVQRRYLGSPPPAYLLRWTISQSSMPWFAARRFAVAVLGTCLVAYGLHIGHPYWAVMTTALIMTIHADRLTLTHRALHRVAGTVIGVGVFFGIHAGNPSGIWITVIALALMFLIQLTVVRNYAVGVMFVTPMALLISTTGNPYVPVKDVVGQRVVETAIGAGMSLLVIWLTGRRTPIRVVRRQFRRALRALERVLILLADGRQDTGPGYEARRNLAFEQLHCARILQLAGRDLPHELGSWDRLETSLGVLTYTVLAACWTTAPLRHLDAAGTASRLQRMIGELPPIGTAVVNGDEVAADLDEIFREGVSPGRV